jgi:hypothetical protein
MDQFEAYLAALRADPNRPPPPELIDDPRYTELVTPAVEIENPALGSKFEAGQYLRRTLSIPGRVLRRDVNLWAWLGRWFFDQLCPPDGSNRRKPKENNKYISRASDHRYGLDKHLLFFPWKMVSLHGDAARVFLGATLGEDPREQREWTGRNLNVSTALVELARRLYSTEADTLKPRCRSNKAPGNLRRFMTVFEQLKVTYDIHGMTVEQLQALLPETEFQRWLT